MTANLLKMLCRTRYIASLLLLLWATPAFAQDVTPTPDPCASIAPDNAPATYYVAWGDVRFDQQNYTSAIVAYSCAIQRDATYAPAYVNRGFAYAAQANDPNALADYETALALDETLLSAYNNRGALYASQGNFGLAINDYTLALTLDPAYLPALNNRALVHAIEGNYDLALADLQRAISTDPTYPDAHRTLGAVYAALAVDSYAAYGNLRGDDVRLPDAVSATRAFDEALETGAFDAWLPLFVAGR